MTNAQLFEDFDWSRCPLGGRSGWSAEMTANIAMLLASDFPMCSVWGERYIQIYNDGYNAIFGEKHPRSFGTPAEDSWPEIWAFLAPALDQVMAGQTLWFAETLLPLRKSKAPEECYFDFSYSPIHGRDGRVEGVLSVAADRTSEVVLRRRQKLAKIAAQHLDKSFEALMRTLQDVLAANEMDCEIAALFSVAAETRTPDGEIWTVRADHGVIGQIRPIAAQALRSGTIVSAAFEGRRAAGIPFFDLKGDPYCALVIVPSELVPFEPSFLPFANDISRTVHTILHATENHQREVGHMRDRIAEQEQVYEFLFDNIQDGIVYCATTGAPSDDEVILAVNARFCEMLGYDATEVLGMSRDAFFSPGDLSLQAALEQRGRGFGFRGELQFRAKDGHLVAVEATSNLVEFHKGQVRSLSLIRDITQYKEAEKARTERIRIETIANLAGALAHDTNNLMTIVIASAETLAEHLPTGSADHQMALNAMVAAERASGLTNQLLTYSLGHPPKPKPMDLNAFLYEIKALIVSALGGLNTLSLNLLPDLPLCLADPIQLTTTVLNLTTNARHAMPDGGTFLIETFLPAELARDGPSRFAQGLVGLRVTDSGTGIPQELQSRVFEPFFTTKSVGSGTGLGLSIVRRLVEDLNGTLHMQSTPGRGTTFELGFQRVQGTDAEVGGMSSASLTSGAVVVYVEDNETIRQQTESMLRQMGAAPATFATGREALRWVTAGGKATLLLTDLVLPGGMSGRDLAAAIRKHEPDLPVLITTGYDPGDGVGRVGYEDFEVLYKPYTRRALEAAILRQLRVQ